MSRLTLVSCAVVFGCTGDIDEGGSVANLTAAQQIALTAWIEDAQPAFVTGTCVTCHEGQMESAGAPPYLLGSGSVAQRDAAIATVPPVVDLSSPRSSRVLVKGMHEGPPLDAVSSSNILIWIQDEQQARAGSAMLPTTTPRTMMPCLSGSAGSATCPINSIDLTSAGAAGTLTFTEFPIGGDTDFDGLTITAGAMGLHVVHPQFGTIPAAGSGSGSGSASVTEFDPLDRYFNVDMEIAPNATLVLGQATFTGFASTDPIVVQFDTLTAKD